MLNITFSNDRIETQTSIDIVLFYHARQTLKSHTTLTVCGMDFRASTSSINGVEATGVSTKQFIKSVYSLCNLEDWNVRPRSVSLHSPFISARTVAWVTEKDLRNRFRGCLDRTVKSGWNESLKALWRRDSTVKKSSVGRNRDCGFSFVCFRLLTDKFLRDAIFSLPQAAVTARIELDHRMAAGTKLPMLNFKR